MAVKTGFWNSVKQTNGIGDRLYNAEDLSFFYDMFFENGISCKNDLVSDMFKVTLTQGSYTVKVNNGNCIIGGKWYRGAEEPAINIPMNTSHVITSCLSRIDAVCIKKDDVNRKFSIYIKEGTEALNPVVPEINKDIELCLAYYTVNASYNVLYNSLVDTRHNKNFAGCAQIKLDQPSYEQEINAYLTKVHYIANGENDNIVLSQMIQDYLAVEKNKDLEITIIGNVGVSGFFSGSGANTDPKVVFALGGYGDNVNNKNKVIVNFTDSAPFSFAETTSNSNNIVVFEGSNMRIKNVKVQAKFKTSAAVYAYRQDSGEITDSYIKIINDGQAYGVYGAGRFINNDIIVLSNTNVARAVVPASKIINATHGRIPLILKHNRILAATASGTAVDIYTFSDATTLIIATENELYKSTDTTYKITNSAYQITSGSAIIQNNMLEVTGTAYTPSDATQTVVNSNNIVFDVLDDKKPLDYYFV